MDSMKSLNRSLPSSSIQPPEQLLQAFKTAALSVTNLYKTAATDQARARQAGYQDALDDLLTFLDKENLGLGDGEGWRVRQWATERLDGTPPAQNGADSDDERGETTEKRAESPSATAQQKPNPCSSPHSASGSSSPARTENIQQPSLPLQQYANVITKSDVFTFRSSHAYPQDIDMQPIDPITTDPPSDSVHNSSTSSSPAPSLRLEVVPRSSKNSHRHNNHASRHNTRSAASTRPLGPGAGSKRRIALGDFFDFGSLENGKDGGNLGGSGGGGGKRNRTA